MKQQNTAVRPPTLRSARLSAGLSVGAIAIGIVALTGYVLGNAPIAAFSADGKPVAAVTGFLLVVLGLGLLALRRFPAGTETARGVAMCAAAIDSLDLLSAAHSSPTETWQVWGERGGVHLHQFPITTFLIFALSAALFFLTTRRDLVGHVIASTILLFGTFTLFAYALNVPAFLAPPARLVPSPPSTSGLVLISLAALFARPRGWVVPLLARTIVGRMLRLLLPAAIAVPFAALGLRDLIENLRGFTPEGGLTVVVVVNVFFGVIIVLGAGLILHEHDRDRDRLASIVESSADAIIGASTAGFIESWNRGAEQMYGYTAAEAIGRPVTMLAPPDRQEEAPQILERIRRSQCSDPFETERVAKDGRRIDVLLSTSPILDDEGGVVGVASIAYDITGRKKAEKAIVESEARYRALVENLPQKIFLKDRNSVYLSANEPYAREFGIEPEAVAGKTDHDFLPEEVAGRYDAEDARIIEAGVTEDFVEELVKGEQRRFTHIVKTPVRDSQGNVTGILGICWDITEKKLAEEKLKTAMADLERSNRDLAKSKAELLEAQRVAQVGHWEWSALTGATTWSDEVYRILGIPIGSVTPSRELFIGMIDPNDRGRFEAEEARALDSSGESDIDVDLRITTQAGAALTIAERVFVNRDAAGNLVGFHGTVQNITQRVKTEEALRDSEAALAEAQQIAYIGSWILYPESGELRASAEMFRLFAVDPGPVARLRLFIDGIHEEDRAGVEAGFAAALQTGTLDLEFRIVTPDGTRVAQCIGRKREGGESRVSLIGTTQDITERKATEEALRQHTESLERSNLELERFNRLSVGRELRMIDLKRQINDLCARLGEPPSYVLSDNRTPAREAS